MKRILCLVIVLVCMCSVASADVKTGKAESISSLFDMSRDLSVWTEISDRNRATAAMLALVDYKRDNPTFQICLDTSVYNKVFYLYADKENNLLHIYLLDNSYNYAHIVCSPDWTYYLYDDKLVHSINMEISLQKVKFEIYAMDIPGLLSYLMTLKEADEIEFDLPAQDTTTPPVSGKSTPSTSSSSGMSASSTSVKKPARIKGPYSGPLVAARAMYEQYRVHRTLKDVLNEYEAYFDQIISELQQMKDKNSESYWNKQWDYMNDYDELMSVLDDENSGLTDDEEQYLIDVLEKINRKFMAVITEGQE